MQYSKKVRNTEGDVYNKAAVLMRELITCHGFASGNKRTAYITASYLIIKNGGRIKFKNFNKVENIIRNIRNFSTEEIAVWLCGGNIDETKIK